MEFAQYTLTVNGLMMMRCQLSLVEELIVSLQSAFAHGPTKTRLKSFGVKVYSMNSLIYRISDLYRYVC